MQDKSQLALRRAAMEAITDKEIGLKAFDLAWPAAAESFLQTAIRMVTSSLLGKIPLVAALAVSASGLADRVTRLSWGLFAMVSAGATVMVARSIGAGNQERANRFAAQTILLGGVSVAMITTVIVLFPEQLITLLYNRDGALASDMVEMAIDYLRLTAWGVPMMSINQIIGAIMRGAGNTRVTMVTNTTANIVNAVLGYMLIYGNFGAPEMGITGAAVATVVSQGVGGLTAVLVFLRFQSNIHLKLPDFRIVWQEVKEVLAVGVPAGSEQVLNQIGNIFLTGFIGSMGAVALAAHSQGITAESISFMPAQGFAIAITTLVSMSVGVGSVKLSERYVRVIQKWNLMVTSLTAALLILAPRQLLSLLSSDPEVISLGAVYLIMMGFCQFPQQVSWVYNGALRGAGDARATMIIRLTGLWGVRIPLSFILGGYYGMGIVGVWWAMAAEMIIGFILSFTRYRLGFWKKTAHEIAGEVIG
ncbi:MAG: MATE family efflux transporter [Symbiobacteriaceae bacterium]|nr:MATE family efflux transporter [Symbiobacteriaceae bacterium]